jgi:serpin B
MYPLPRRSFLALLAAPLLVPLLEACGDDQPESADVSDARSDLARVAAPTELATVAATSMNDFGTALYRQLAAADPTGNIVLSPASIAIALSMAGGGAVGLTLDEMLATLEASDPTTLHSSMNALTAALDELDTAAADGDADGGVTLSIANSLWGQQDLAFQPTFLDLLATQYGAGMELVDFRNSPEAARVAINDWVSDETEERIPELLGEGVISEATRLVLVNAIYLLAPWARTFSADNTVDAPFTTAAGEMVQVPSMQQSALFPYAAGDGWQAVELPYENSSLAMLIFVPEPGNLGLFEEIFLVTDATQYLQSRQVQLQLPKFDIESKFSLADQLSALGMPTAFTDAADFSGITTDEKLLISAVVHQANITVTEEGTEAAAATAVVVDATSAPTDDPVELIVDRPFVFALRDTATGAVLFLGRVGNPSLTRS